MDQLMATGEQVTISLMAMALDALASRPSASPPGRSAW